MNLSKADRISLIYFLSRLNGFLESESFNNVKFSRTLNRLKKRFNPQIGIIDFYFFNEQRHKKARREKLRGEQFQSFGYVRNQRIVEQVCERHIELKSLLQIEKSTFLYEENILMFCHLGSSRNDLIITQVLGRDEMYVKMSIRV